MNIAKGWGSRARAMFNDKKGPWGSGKGGSGNDGSGGDDPTPPLKGPWGDPPSRGGSEPGARGAASSLDDFLKKNRDRFGGGGGGGRPGGGGGVGGAFARDPSLLWWGFAGLVLLWLIVTSVHSVAPAQAGVVTRFGRYSHTLPPGVSITLPAPFDRVQKVDVEKNNEINLGSASTETLVLTGDQNIIDIAYQVRWKIRSPEQYLFQLKDPEGTIEEVAESAMRAVVANVSLQGAMGNQRGEIESRVATEMQKTLDFYQSGVLIQGVAIRQADPPAAVNDAFKEVTAAQQEAQSYINQANAYSLQLGQKAQGEATAFDKVYEQYKLSPVVTRRRMYYETMERVLQKVDKTIVEAPGVNSYLPLGDLRRPAPKEPAQ